MNRRQQPGMRENVRLAQATDRRVGVVIPVFNRRTILLETLQHVAAQTLPPSLLVIVDDGSTDGTADAAHRWLSEAQPTFEWRIVRCQHIFASAARNRGFELVRNLPLVAFLDSDDHWPHDFLERAVDTFQQDIGAVAVSADRVYFTTNGTLDVHDLQPMVANPIPWFFANGAGIASCTVVRSAAVERIGGWNPDLTAEDADFFSRIAGEGTWRHLAGAPVAFQVGSAQSRGEEKNLTQFFDDRNLRWARDFEQIYEAVLRREPKIDTGPLRAALAYRWNAAAKQLVKLGRLDEAQFACARALHWRVTNLGAWRLRLRLALSPTV